jgi:2-oxoglutarate dehydrogenase E2 component (dihydrolipoamide succinyltransferase)
MAVDIVVPSPGESITEGIIARWAKKNGAFVRTDELLFEMETDKATVPVNAECDGVLTILVPEGQKVAVKSVVGRIEPAPAGSAPPPRLAPKTEKRPPVADTQPSQPKAPVADAPGSSPASGAPLSPSARQWAADKSVDAARLTGSGRGGRIIKEDVLAHLHNSAIPEAPVIPMAPPREEPEAEISTPPPETTAPKIVAPPVQPGARETRQRMTTIRQRIAERLLAAQQSAAILTTFNEADMSAIMALRTRYKETFQKKTGAGLGFMSFFVRACVEALKAFPAVNARMDGTDIIYHHFYDLGVAVSTEKGLMVPVLRNADQLSFAQIEKGIAELAQRARDNKITINDLLGGTFTITNGGVFGSLLSTPILNPPQSAILGMHTIQKRPVVVDDQIVVRPMMYLALSYDHRLIDGREAVSFLVRVKECIESPERLLLEI